MKKYHIELSDEEKALVEAIDLHMSHSNHDERHTAYKANQRPILALLESLSARGAIPEGRLNYWNDPDYYTGRLKASHKGSGVLFEGQAVSSLIISGPFQIAFPMKPLDVRPLSPSDLQDSPR